MFAAISLISALFWTLAFVKIIGGTGERNCLSSAVLCPISKQAYTQNSGLHCLNGVCCQDRVSDVQHCQCFSGFSGEHCDMTEEYNSYYSPEVDQQHKPKCPVGRFGTACNESCHCQGDRLFGEQCFRNGSCPAGCQPGWTGHTCGIMIDAGLISSSTRVILITATLITVVLLLIAVIACFVYRRHRRQLTSHVRACDTVDYGKRCDAAFPKNIAVIPTTDYYDEIPLEEHYDELREPCVRSYLELISDEPVKGQPTFVPDTAYSHLKDSDQRHDYTELAGVDGKGYIVPIQSPEYDDAKPGLGYLELVA